MIFKSFIVSPKCPFASFLNENFSSDSLKTVEGSNASDESKT